MHMGGLPPVYVCALISVPNTYGGQKRSSHLLELELQMIVNCQWVLGIELWFSTRAMSAFSH